MQMKRWFCGAVAFALGACGQVQTNPTVYQAGLQYSGAVGVSPPTAPMRIEISAEILPNAVVWQYKGGDGYPPTVAELQQLVNDSTYSFPTLLTACAAKDPSIVIRADQALTPAELASNYTAVAECAYRDYGAKPYWMPQILNDVDVCASKLGGAWHLLAASDLASLTEADYQGLQDTLAVAAKPLVAGQFPTSFYYALTTYLRDANGQLALANLTPNAVHISPLPIATSAYRDLYLGQDDKIVVRCARAIPAAP